MLSINPFHVGDVVRCVDVRNYSQSLTLGKYYEVMEVDGELISVITNKGQPLRLLHGRFELFSRGGLLTPAGAGAAGEKKEIDWFELNEEFAKQ